MRMLIVRAHRWFDKVNGNTYFSARMRDPNTDETLARIEFAYGYGDHYQYEILDAAIRNGHLPALELNASGNRIDAPWSYYQKHGIKVEYFCTDGLKRDLKNV